MCGRLAQAVVLGVVYLAWCLPSSHAQLSAAGPEADAEAPPQIAVTIAELKFEGSIRLPVEDQEQLAASVKRESYAVGADGLIDDVLERYDAGGRTGGLQCGSQ